ncbi:MAG: secretion system protein [Chloroflexi bacterium]|nr:MAG: secretion system protein [Chloroflexota bacterium]
MAIPLITGVLFAIGVILVAVNLDGARLAAASSVAPASLPVPGAPKRPIGSIRDRIDRIFEPAPDGPVVNQRRSAKASLSEQLSRADLRLRTSEFLGIRLGSALLLALVGVIRFGIGWQMLVTGAFGWFIPRFYLRFRRRRRLKAFNDQLGDTLILMSNALKTGYSLAQAIDVVANKASPPISKEFDRVVKEVNLGANIEDSLTRLVRRTESSDLDMVVTAVAINRKIGGNLSEILENIAETIRERVRIKGEMSTLTAQARGSGYMITGLPIVLGIFMYFVTPQYFAPMVANPIGIGMLVAAGIFMGLGQLIMSRIATVDV